MAFIDCNEQGNARKSAWPDRPHCNHGPWISNGTMWLSRKKNRQYLNKRIPPAHELLGGKCANCGSTDNLEFDHIDRTTKDFEVRRLLQRRHLSDPELKAELAKCQLLCKRCHRAKTNEEMSGSGNPNYSKSDQLEALINQHESEAA